MGKGWSVSLFNRNIYMINSMKLIRSKSVRRSDPSLGFNFSFSSSAPFLSHCRMHRMPCELAHCKIFLSRLQF